MIFSRMDGNIVKNSTCRVKPEGNFDAFILETQRTDKGFLEILDRSGKLPLDAFDEINEALEFGDTSGRVHSEERDHHYAWEIME